ncbi:MAG: aminotransferase class I/II-fold pyridoxal phosphate-dependent enzyme [Melioribacteraceae bacterium]|nr:aminotransferase class I/II-fold pyridoxal phosphate-dependent enzyme [Melioribacteraceae bacterium]MCF8265299.1 aminotransferase class I/II-fold pyridoxal phosphate-dependent enzyme [Melioribacteraceae bacterium]MCF8414332.1 aminotransferase class I/II-fold pyridoxal phosphate-dependent enzyme [Melioribacteraceae bacterium]
MSDNKEKKTSNEEKYSMETHIIYGKNETNKWDYSHHVTAPISSSTTFRLDSVERGAAGFMQFANTTEHGDEAPIFIYDRLGEPNKDMLEENLAYAEKGEMALSFSSGMGAISAVLGILTSTGDDIVTHNTLYGCTISLLMNWYPKYQISNTPVDLTNVDNLLDAVTEKTKVIYLETPANPNLDVIDIQKIAEIIDKINQNREPANRINIVVDNTFATSFCQRPITLGADFVIHSLTKGIGGFGTDMGGVVVGRKEFRDRLLLYRKDFGAVLGTKSAWAILTYGLPTLPLRQRHQIQTAKLVSDFLEKHPKVEFVNYPGLASFKGYELAKKQMIDFNGNFAPGSLVYFGLKGSTPEESKNIGGKFMDYVADNSYTMTLAVSLGHTRTLIEHPASMTHSVVPADKLHERGLHPGGVRLALGLENPDDILLDLDEALKQL